MNQFSIRDIENLTGIKAHTIRIWEQRFSIITPKRKESAHRIYDSEDLKKILRIAYLYNNGMKISKIASLNEDDVRKLALEPDKVNDSQIFINQLIEAALDFDQPAFENILTAAILKTGFENSISQIIFPVLNKIGLMWMVNRMSPAQEHFASAIILNKIISSVSAYPRVLPEPGKKFILIFTPEEEMHEIPLIALEYLLRKNGIAYINAGKHCAQDVLMPMYEKHKFTDFYFHLITNLRHSSLEEYLQKLSSTFPLVSINYSGVVSDILPSNVNYLRDEKAMKNYIKQLQAV
ncbi:MAG: MerR family transcriptional regulator [Flavitalea sp.]